MKHTIEIKECGHGCPFFGNSMDGMQCDHPYWIGKDAYANMIINQDNIYGGRVPEKCPLKSEDLTIHFKLNKNV